MPLLAPPLRRVKFLEFSFISFPFFVFLKTSEINLRDYSPTHIVLMFPPKQNNTKKLRISAEILELETQQAAAEKKAKSSVSPPICLIPS